MLLTIHNLPPNVTLAGIKKLIQDNCNISQIILDNLSNEGQGKRVTVGLADEGDAALLVKKLNGFYMNGYRIFVEDIRQKKNSEQPYCPMNIPQMAPVPESKNPPFNMPMNMTMQPPPPPTMPPGYSNVPFYVSSAQNKYVTYNTAPPFVNPVPPPSSYQQNVPYGYNTNDGQSQWKDQAVTYPALGPNPTSNETRQYSSRPQETNWRDRRDSPSRSTEGQGRHDSESFDRSHNETSRRNEHNRSDYRRDDDANKCNRYSRAERSPPRERHDNRESRDGRFDNNRRGTNRGEQNRDRYGSNNQNYDNRRPDRDYGQNNQFHNKKRDFGSKRSYAENSEAHSSTFSNNPGNSTFTNTKPNNFGQKSSNFQTGGFNTNNHGPPSKKRRFDNKTHFSTKPPVKLNPPVKSANQKADGVIPKDTLQTMLNRHLNWIGNASAQLATVIIKNSGVEFIPKFNEFNKKLKRCILSRIDVLLHDHITTSLQEVITAYRSKFTVDDDPVFFQAVMEKHMRDLNESGRSNTVEQEGREKRLNPSTSDNKDGIAAANPSPQVSCPTKDPKPSAGKGNTIKTTQHTAQQKPSKKSNWENFKNTPNPRLDIRKPDPCQRLPKVPKRGQKKLASMVSEEEYFLDPFMKKALDEEMNEFCKGFLEGCDESIKYDETMQCNYDNIFGEKIKHETLTVFKQIIELHLTKRLLNVTNNLVVRIHSHPKLPTRIVLEEFLKQYNVMRVKKKEKRKMFLAKFATYKDYDDLLHLAKAKVGDNYLQFRPMTLSCPKGRVKCNGKVRISNIRPENIISDDEVEMLQEESNMDIEDLDHDDQENDFDNSDSNEDDEHDDDSINPDDNDTHIDDAKEKRLNDSDVILQESKTDVVVIEDNDININKISNNVQVLDDGKNSKVTDVPNVKNNEATAAPKIEKNETTDAPNVKNNEATAAPKTEKNESTDAPNVKNNVATATPNIKKNEATDTPIVKNNEEADAPNIYKDDVNKNVEKFDEFKVDEVSVRDDDLEDF